MSLSLENIKISSKINLITLLSVAALCAIVFLSMQSNADLLWQAYADRTRSSTDIVFTLIQEYQARVKNGEFSLQEGQARALKRIQSIRYDGDNYFWVNDLDGKMLMHPTSPKLNGTDIRGIKDADGSHLFVNMIEIVKKKGEGSLRYQWPPGNEQKPKVSYVKGIPEWGWLVGTGVFADKIQDDVQKEAVELLTVAGAAGLVTLLISIVIGRGISRPIRNITSIMKSSQMAIFRLLSPKKPAKTKWAI